MYKRITRIYEGNIFGGVCTGLGKYFNIDPVIFRILFLVLFFMMGTGALLYLIMWIIIPNEQNLFPPNNQQNNNQQNY